MHLLEAIYNELVVRIELILGYVFIMSGFLDVIKVVEQKKIGFLDDIVSSAVKYSDIYYPVSI